MLSTSLQIVTVAAVLAIFQGVCAEDVSILEQFVHTPSFFLRGCWYLIHFVCSSSLRS